MTIEMKSRKASDVVILDLPGRLSAFERTLWLRINEFINNGERHFVLNLSDIDYLDAGGLGQLVSVWTLVRSSGGWVTLLHPRKRVRSLLELTKLDTIFEIFDQEIQAVSRGHTKPNVPSSGGREQLHSADRKCAPISSCTGGFPPTDREIYLRSSIKAV